MDSKVVQFLDVLADMIGHYGCHQIECGAQVIQVFESWSHFLSPREFELLAKPAVQKTIFSGVMQGTLEEAVGWLVDECRRYTCVQW